MDPAGKALTSMGWLAYSRRSLEGRSSSCRDELKRTSFVRDPVEFTSQDRQYDRLRCEEQEERRTRVDSDEGHPSPLIVPHDLERQRNAPLVLDLDGQRLIHLGGC